VQRLARQAVRDVREAVAGVVSPSLETELGAAEIALHSADIKAVIERNGGEADPAYETTLAWAVREAVTNVVRHSGARTCWIRLNSTENSSMLEIEDDGLGPVRGGEGTGLHGLEDRVHALGGAVHVSAGEKRGFRVRVHLGLAATRPTYGALTR
jgi:two-component system sensor histidine kinase DesK